MDFPKSVPNIGLVGGLFVDEDTTAGRPGSLIPSVWGNSITLEVLNVLTQAGVVPDEFKTDQLAEAISKLVGSGVAASAKKLQTARVIGFTGAATGAGSFDGSSDVYITLTLSSNGVIPGSYSKVQIDSRGLVIGSSALVLGDIPNLDWSKITSGKPTTLAGYGITDALQAGNSIVPGTYAKVQVDARGIVIGSSGLIQADIPSLDWSKITSGKPTTLGGYGITDALNLSAKASQADIESAAPANKWIDPAGAFLATQDVLCGMIFFHASSAPPPGSLKANGAWVSRTTYAKLFARIGTFYGPGDGVTSFTLPDVRAESPRFWDDARGVDSGRTFGSFQGGALEAHSHAMSAGNDWTYNNVATTNTKPFKEGLSSYPTGVTGGSETRPRNLAFLGCIKY